MILRNACLDVVEQSRDRAVDVAAFHPLQEHRAEEFRCTVKGDVTAPGYVWYEWYDGAYDYARM